ncbi:MFS transporter [Bradyrhizobium liaoningense]|uniref:MFS transporter n=1 Tax=Bradyrhizobium liaoningense TaxID=43992 RepID=UPI001BA85F3E|nr:MFS transporter [Bradyrhizobium liaoningense]MBR1031499.1 MFS transporter [Bradyrhizobium liaoningense]
MSRARTEAKALILLVTFFPQCVVSMLSMTPPVMAVQIALSLGLPPQIAGVYVGLVYAGAISSSSFAASLITRFGPLRTSFICVVTSGAGLTLLAVPHLAAALLATAIIGLSYGPLTPASSHVLARYRSDAGMAFLVSTRQTSVPMGGVLAGFIVPPLVLGLGWNAACVAIGGVTAALGAAVWIAAPVVRNEHPDRPHGHGYSLFEPVRFIARRPGLASLATSSVVYSAMQLVVSSFLVLYLTSAAGLDLVLAGALLSANQLAGVAGRLGWGFVADRVAAPRLLLLGIALLMAIAAGLMSLFTATWPVCAIAAVVILLGATASGWNGVFLAEIIRDVRPAEVALATAGSMMFAYIGTVIGPTLFGGLASAVGFSNAYLFMGAAVLLAGIIGALGRANQSDSAQA